VQPSPPPSRYFSVNASAAASPKPPLPLSRMSRQKREVLTASEMIIARKTKPKSPAMSECGMAS
jgi:hypothetical protein